MKNEHSSNTSPFEISRPGGNLEFDNNKDTAFDRTIRTSGEIEDCANAFSNRDNKNELALYLNATWIGLHKNKK